jgi:imidazolonepropionase-like amidohydrolase
VALATDHPVIPAQFFLDQVSAIHLRTGLTPDELLPMITENAARAIGCEDRIGQLKPGYDADVVICSAPPGDPTCRVLRTIVDGKQVYENKDNIPGHI